MSKSRPESTPNPLPCGCAIIAELVGGPNEHAVIRFCPLHAAAEDLLTALDRALSNHRIQCDLADRMGYTAPTKASWVPFARAAVAKARPAKEQRAGEEKEK